MCWVFSEPGRPADFDNSRTRHTVLAVGAGGVCWICWIWIMSIFSLFFLPLSGKRPDVY